jgi:L-threonylcarbamoyladenylate synthase
VSIIRYRDEDQEQVIETVIVEFEAGKPVVLPTETLYGIGAPVSNSKAVERIFELKQRPHDLTLPIAVGNLPMVDDIAVIHRWQKNSLRDGLPGPVTFILEAKGITDPLLVRNGTIGVRVPRHPLFIPLCTKVGPLGLTSANIHGGPEIHLAEDIDQQFKGELLVVKDDRAIGGKGSTVIDLTEEIPTVLREGNLNIDEFMGGQYGRG